MQAMSQLYYIMGASGVGKDSVMAYARKQIKDPMQIIFAHRYITRPADSGGENHIALSHQEFRSRLKAGLFALHWESHNQLYGIGNEIDLWMEKGCKVVVNGSRQYLPEARIRYPSIQAILIEASPETIKSRLSSRGRESNTEIEKRMARNEILAPRVSAALVVIRNDGPLEGAGRQLLQVITEQY